jgi:ATP-dependent RNA helicase DeaD
MSQSDDTKPSQEGPVFGDFALDGALLRQLDAMGFEKPTPIQSQAMPHLLEGKDIIARARTGSGKTAAFGLPLLDKVKDGGKHVRALVLTPTRELAQQIGEALRTHGKGLTKVRGVTVYGGAPYPPQIRALKEGSTVVVGTPGRLIDLLQRGVLNLSKLELLVLDEADEMLRMGFIEDVETLLAGTPEDRQVALFSATMPPAIQKVATTYLKDPVVVQVEGKALSVDHIEQRYVVVPSNRKLEALIRLLQVVDRRSMLVFARTRASCAQVAEELSRRGFPAEALHGDLNQNARERVLNRLRNGTLKLLIATDVAARGLDVAHLSHVVNLDVPDSRESYVHRIGRTGRAGRPGTAITLVTPSGRRFVRLVEQTLGVQMSQYDVPSDADIAQFQRRRLLKELAQDGSDTVADAERWLKEVSEEQGWTLEEAAARSIDLLARRDGVSLRGVAGLDDEPPGWARYGRPKQGNDREQRPSVKERSFERASENAPVRAPRTKNRLLRESRPALKQRGFGSSENLKKPRDFGGSENLTKPKDFGGSENPKKPRDFGGSENLNEVQIFVASGHRHGTEPADLVGALTNETGIAGANIGQIHVTEKASFIGLPKAVAEEILQDHQKIQIRGRDITISLSLTQPPTQEKLDTTSKRTSTDGEGGRKRISSSTGASDGPRARPKKPRGKKALKGKKGLNGKKGLKVVKPGKVTNKNKGKRKPKAVPS